MLIVADNFIRKYQDANLITTDNELRVLASAKVVIPKVVLSKSKVEGSLDDLNTVNQNNYTTIDAKSINDKLIKYKKAIKELETVNSKFIEDLSNADLSQIPNSGSSSGTDKDAAIKEITKEDVIDVIGNPLDKEKLISIVSEDTILIIEELELKSLQNPVKAIQSIEKEMNALNDDLFINKKLSKKQVVVGGSIIEINDNSNISFSDGCFPTIIDSVGLNIGQLADSTRYIRATESGFGNSGGASEEKILDYGSMSFMVGKPPVGAGYYVGLSPQNNDANFNSIKYAVKLGIYPHETNSVSVHYTQAFVNGLPVGNRVNIAFRDQIRISRVESTSGEVQILWHKINPVTNLITLIHQSNDESPSSTLEPLQLDFSFSRFAQGFYNVLLDPCDKPSGNNGSNESTCSGITNLGVSDYMRVEQEVCCYTAGEVSHIENIMQGEFKERSTRRLRRQETTTTFETESSTEKLRDTTTTDRYEMEQESSQIIQEDSAFDIGVTLSTRFGPTKLTVDSGFATASSSTDANSQAVSYAKEVSSRALERVTNSVREERVNKVIEEFEENNLHGLDNTNNANGHVTGLYRWVDKIYTNQIVNYGKRLTFEFMIPEPAKFHLWAMAKDESNISLEKPEDPRDNGLPKHTSLTEFNYAQWAAEYDAKIVAPPPLFKTVSKAYHLDKTELDLQIFSKSFNDLALPNGYKGISADVWMYWIYLDNDNYKIEITVGNQSRRDPPNFATFNLGNIEGILPIAVGGDEVYVIKLNIVASCKRKDEIMEQWRIETFNKIIEAYNNKKAAYDNAVAEAKAQASLGIQIQGNNPLYNRTIEQQELKKNCLKWLEVEVGNSHYNELNVCSDAEDMPNLQTSEDLACYAKKAKFFEQAFDWDIMSYLFYSYFWGKQCSWKEIYKLDDNDPVFRGFLQAGMSRVVVPVKPNYETAVMYYLETGDVWNGGEVPIPGDPLYQSIVDDLAEQDPTPVGDPWETRVPTSLNILQKDSAAIEGDGLPCNCNDYEGDGTGGSTLSGSPDGGIGKFKVS